MFVPGLAVKITVELCPLTITIPDPPPPPEKVGKPPPPPPPPVLAVPAVPFAFDQIGRAHV